MINILERLLFKPWNTVMNQEQKKVDTKLLERRLGDYAPQVIEAHGHPTPLPPEPDDGPLTERCPSGLDPLHEVDVDVSDHRELTAAGDIGSNVETVSLFIEPLTPGAIYLVKRPSTRYTNANVLEPMFLRTYQDDIVQFQDMMGERLTMGTNLARQSIQKRYTTKDVLEALGKTV